MISPVGVQARGASSSSTSGSSTSVSTSAGSHEAVAASAGGAGLGPGTEHTHGLRGGISNAPGTGKASSSVSFPEPQGTGATYGPQISSDIQSSQVYSPQQSMYGYPESVPADYGAQTGIYAGSDFQNRAYGSGYGPVSVQAPATVAGGRGGSVQALSGAGPAQSCLSTCTEEFTPYECSTHYCGAR